MKKVYVVDMVNGFCKEGALHDKKILEIIPNIIRELNMVPREQRVFITDCHDEKCTEFRTFPPHCIEGTNEPDVVAELQPYCSRILKKNSTNAIHVMNINDELLDVDEVVITGCCTDICVLQLALSVKTWCNQNDIKVDVIVPHDCVATYDIPKIHEAKEYHNIALKLMENAGVHVV